MCWLVNHSYILVAFDIYRLTLTHIWLTENKENKEKRCDVIGSCFNLVKIILKKRNSNRCTCAWITSLPCLVNTHSDAVTDGILNSGTFICDTLVIMIGGSPRTLCCQADGLIRHALVSVQEWACFYYPWAVCSTALPHWMDSRGTN